MRNRALHDALRDFALEAAALLVSATESGAEIGYALDERATPGPTLYSYRPLTADFIAASWPQLRRLPAFEAAARALGTGARAYLRRRGEPGADAEPALRAMLERLYEDSTGFAFPEERFERVYDGVERALYAGTVRSTVIAAVDGLRLEGARLELGGDLSLVDPALLAPLPDPGLLDGHGEQPRATSAHLQLERDVPADAPLPLEEARLRFSATLVALRLLEPAEVALSALGHARLGEGDWRPVLLSSGGRGRGLELLLRSDELPRLRELLEAVEAAPAQGALAWALERFALGLEREHETQALSDHLLALRALFDRGGRADAATVALRLAGLCAEQGERRAVQSRIESAFALEPFLIEGGLGAARGRRYVEAVGRHGPRALVRELEDALRVLLAGVLCGDLDADLAGMADEILLRTGEPVEIRARRLDDPEGEESAGEGGRAESAGARIAAGPPGHPGPAGHPGAPAAAAVEAREASSPDRLELDEDGENYFAPV